MEMAKAYEASSVESRLYAEWLEAGLFDAQPTGSRPYCITIPPPNITGSLHIGHALNNTILDAMTRMHRMMGDSVLCLPGTDHAGIGTQNVVERDLAKEGLSRHDLGREAFIERCWEWRRQYGDRIYSQFQKLGCSFDWSRARFTMDESYVDAIYEVFIRWWEEGLIYRGARVVNWCPRCRSAISDIEVSSSDRAGKLYRLRYPLADGSGYVIVATTRPETMLGDTAVAVHPDDPRYTDLVGRLITLPLVGREVQIVADTFVRMDFGTGAVKVTPAHDLDDYECGLRNRLPLIVVIGEDGSMTAEAGAYAGLDRDEARARVLRDLDAQGLLDGSDDYTVKTPLCDRCHTVLEPLLSEQWFVNQRALAGPAIEAVRSGEIRFRPERYERIYMNWMENIRDWCISRQLWWGHRIPVWWTEDGRCSAGRSAEDAADRLGVSPNELRQDDDVLDTWFSSALWPFATLGWPGATDDLAFWYPTALLSTASEILYLWVARMVMTGMHFVGRAPFRDVYIHATVLDAATGERMSKSKGNGVDPVEMIERYGADALRFSLMQQAGLNQDIRFSEDRVRVAGAFCNKLWNVSRFVLMNLEEGDVPTLDDVTARLALPDRWILSRLNAAVKRVSDAMPVYEMDDAARAIYEFLWDEFCDWYVEMAKPRLRDEEAAPVVRAVLAHVLDTMLRLAHPFIPFVTAEIWRSVFPDRATLVTAPWPNVDASRIQPAAEERIALVLDAVHAIRNLRAEVGVAPSARVDAALSPRTRRAGEALTDCAHLISALARLSSLQFVDAQPTGTGRWVAAGTDACDLFVEVGSGLDLVKEVERAEKELVALQKEIEKCQAKLGNTQFTDRAPAEIVQREQKHLSDLEERRASLAARLAMLKA